MNYNFLERLRQWFSFPTSSSAIVRLTFWGDARYEVTPSEAARGGNYSKNERKSLQRTIETGSEAFCCTIVIIWSPGSPGKRQSKGVTLQMVSDVFLAERWKGTRGVEQQIRLERLLSAMRTQFSVWCLETARRFSGWCQKLLAKIRSGLLSVDWNLFIYTNEEMCNTRTDICKSIDGRKLEIIGWKNSLLSTILNSNREAWFHSTPISCDCN